VGAGAGLSVAASKQATDAKSSVVLSFPLLVSSRLVLSSLATLRKSAERALAREGGFSFCLLPAPPFPWRGGGVHFSPLRASSPFCKGRFSIAESGCGSRSRFSHLLRFLWEKRFPSCSQTMVSGGTSLLREKKADSTSRHWQRRGNVASPRPPSASPSLQQPSHLVRTSISSSASISGLLLAALRLPPGVFSPRSVAISALQLQMTARVVDHLTLVRDLYHGT